MKFLSLVLFLVQLGEAQGPVVTVNTSISASAGNLTCVGTPSVNTSNVPQMHLVCNVGTVNINTSDSTVPSTPATSVTISVQSGVNVITLILTKGNPIPDQWQISVTDGTTTKMKNGSF